MKSNEAFRNEELDCIGNTIVYYNWEEWNKAYVRIIYEDKGAAH
jgi:hypothetical protein